MTHWAAVVLALWGAAPSMSDEARPALVVLDFEGKGVPALQVEAATRGAIRGLRALDVFQVLGADEVRQLLAIERSRQIMGVAGENTVLSDVSRVLGTRHVVSGTVVSVAGALTVEMKLLDTSAQQVLSQKTLGPVKLGEMALQIPSLAQELVSPLLAAQQGSLLVRCKEEGAEIVVDDVLVASTPQQAPIKLARGSHRLQVRKDGFIAQSRTVTIVPDQVTEAELMLLPSPDYAEAYKLRHGRLRTGAYIAGGFAVAAIASGLLLDRLATEPAYQNEFLPRQYALNGTLLRDVRPASRVQDPLFQSAYETCGASPGQCQQEASEIQSRIATQEIVTASLVGAGIAATGVAMYLWLSGEDPNRYADLIAGVRLEPGAAGWVLAARF